MPAFDNNWETLGYHRGPIDYYLVNSTLFGGWQNAMPLDIVTALETAGYDNPLLCPSRATPVTWFLRKVTGQQVTQLAERDPIEGAATASNTGCIEHAVHWPAVGGKTMPASSRASQFQTRALGNSGDHFFTRNGTVIIYSTWQPCLSCCNSLFALAREYMLDFNLVVRFKRVYDIALNGPLADATLVIPRPNLLLSNATPASTDRAVFFFHDDHPDLRNLGARPHFRGEMKPVVHRDTRPNPHLNRGTVSPMHPGGTPCQGQAFTGAELPWDNNFPTADCSTCHEDVALSPLGSGVPWAVRDANRVCAGYVATRNYTATRLAV